MRKYLHLAGENTLNNPESYAISRRWGNKPFLHKTEKTYRRFLITSNTRPAIYDPTIAPKITTTFRRRPGLRFFFSTIPVIAPPHSGSSRPGLVGDTSRLVIGKLLHSAGCRCAYHLSLYGETQNAIDTANTAISMIITGRTRLKGRFSCQ